MFSLTFFEKSALTTSIKLILTSKVSFAINKCINSFQANDISVHVCGRVIRLLTPLSSISVKKQRYVHVHPLRFSLM